MPSSFELFFIFFVFFCFLNSHYTSLTVQVRFKTINTLRLFQMIVTSNFKSLISHCCFPVNLTLEVIDWFEWFFEDAECVHVLPSLWCVSPGLLGVARLRMSFHLLGPPHPWCRWPGRSTPNSQYRRPSRRPPRQTRWVNRRWPLLDNARPLLLHLFPSVLLNPRRQCGNPSGVALSQ